MRRRWVQAGLMLGTAVRGLQASSVTSAIAVVTIAIALVLVGSFALLVINMRGLLDHFGEELHIIAYLDDGIVEDEQRALATRVSKLQGIQGVELVSKHEALERFRRSYGGAELLEGLEENPLPTSLEIVLESAYRTGSGMDDLVRELSALAGIEELAHGQEWVEGYSRAASLVRAVGFGLGGVLCLAALLIVANTIRLAVYAREDEIQILDLVGASRSFVRIPFVIEGILQGAIGGLLACGMLYLSFRVLLPQIEYGLELFLGNAAPHFFAFPQVVAIVAGGAVLGLVGSATALFGWRS